MFRTSLCLVVTSIISVQGFAMDLQEDDVDKESRIFTSGGGLNLNSSTLTVLAGLTAALLLGLLALLAFAPRASTTSGGYGQSSNGYGQRGSHDYDYYDDSYRRRSGSGVVDDLKDQLNLLAEAFHKYEIAEDTGCQLYIACESSSSNHYKNRPLAKTVYTAMREISKPQNADLYEDDKYLMDILNAYDLGTKGQSCEHFRKLCKNDKIFG